MKKIIHPIAGSIAMLAIFAFWVSTAVSELFGSYETIAQVKSWIPWGFTILIPALAATGGTGAMMARGARAKRTKAKQLRMPVIAANGIIVLVPSAFYLAWKAQNGEFDTLFYGVQAIELAAGALNLFLMGLNMRDGLALTGRIAVQNT